MFLATDRGRSTSFILKDCLPFDLKDLPQSRPACPDLAPTTTHGYLELCPLFGLAQKNLCLLFGKLTISSIAFNVKMKHGLRTIYHKDHWVNVYLGFLVVSIELISTQAVFWEVVGSSVSDAMRGLFRTFLYVYLLSWADTGRYTASRSREKMVYIHYIHLHLTTVEMKWYQKILYLPTVAASRTRKVCRSLVPRNIVILALNYNHTRWKPVETIDRGK